MTYEEMLELGDKLGKVQKGFSTDIIAMIPKKQIK